ncbi:MAG TPA: Gfo/Idh/MocA family oxidoreductase [Thermomicrobiales bacterium]|jgi:predicted dehydrogenase
MTTAKVQVGLIGCGTISAIYLKNREWFDTFEIVACADLDMDRARARAEEFGVPHACTVAELLDDPTITVVINLTVPQAHATVALAAVRADKSVYNEKPLTLSREEGQLLLDEARAAGVRVGCAPDTFLGAGLQTCRQLIDEGKIGEPVAATAFLASHGPEGWHPNPDFYYQVGGGPLFDMAPYYLTALINLLGPVRRVSGSARASFPTRTIGSEPFKGQTITVNTPTHVATTLDFTAGAIGTMITSFDVWSHSLPRIEIYGSTGTLSVPDPNTFGGPVRWRGAEDKEWTEIPVTRAYDANSRILGLADMVQGIIDNRPHRASGELAFHVLDIMHAALESSEQGQHITLTSTCERPAALPKGLAKGSVAG